MRERRKNTTEEKTDKNLETFQGENQKRNIEVSNRGVEKQIPHFGALGEIPDDILWVVVEDKEISYKD